MFCMQFQQSLLHGVNFWLVESLSKVSCGLNKVLKISWAFRWTDKNWIQILTHTTAFWNTIPERNYDERFFSSFFLFSSPSYLNFGSYFFESLFRRFFFNLSKILYSRISLSWLPSTSILHLEQRSQSLGQLHSSINFLYFEFISISNKLFGPLRVRDKESLL